MHLWHDSLSSKDLLEACVAFAMGLTFVIAFRWKGARSKVSTEVTTTPNRLTVDI